MRARVNAEKVIKGAMMSTKRRLQARFARKVEWLRMRIAVRRIERKWFKEQAFRARVMVCVYMLCVCVCVCAMLILVFCLHRNVALVYLRQV